MTQAPCRAAVLVSGGGSNLQSLIDAANANPGDMEIAIVLSNRPDAYGLERAARAGIPAHCVDHTAYANREAFDAALVAALRAHAPDIVLLAGFMRILTPVFIDAFPGKILNIHPSLLPKYRGLHTHQRAIDAGDQWHGCTVHFASAELDGGPAIIQARVPVEPADTAESLAARVLRMEHRIYPEAAHLLATGRIACRDGATWLDGKRLQQPISID